MSTSELIKSQIKDIVSIAQYAPSVHNTQPWLVQTENDTIVVSIDPEHRLHDGDPTGRQTTISLGIFAEAVVLASKKFGLRKMDIQFMKDKARIKFVKGRALKVSSEDIDALKSRATDRSIYSAADIKKKDSSKILKTTNGINAKAWVITDASDISKIAGLTAKGIGIALSNPSFRSELSKYLVVPWSRKNRGISTSSLYIPKILSLCEPLLMRAGIGIDTEVSLEKRRWLSASGIIFITTTGDMPYYWFEAGRAYLHVALKIEQLGFSQATSAATVEASNYHEDVETLLGTSQRLQSVIRIGKGVKSPHHSPRVPAEALITLI